MDIACQRLFVVAPQFLYLLSGNKAFDGKVALLLKYPNLASRGKT